MVHLGAAPEPGLESLGKFTDVMGHGGLPGRLLRPEGPGELPRQPGHPLQVLLHRLFPGPVVADVRQIFGHKEASPLDI